MIHEYLNKDKLTLSRWYDDISSEKRIMFSLIDEELGQRFTNLLDEEHAQFEGWKYTNWHIC